MNPLRRPELLAILAEPRLLVVDLELTCGPGVTADVQDIIEFAAIALDRAVPATSDQAESLFIRPERSAVTDFCTQLTGITPEQVATAPVFADQLDAIRDLADRSGARIWVSWGPDHTLLHRQCESRGLPDPLGHLGHADIRRLLTGAIFELTGALRPQGSGAGVGLATAMKVLGLEPHGRQHSGRVDAFNAARVLQDVRRRIDASPASAPRRTRPA